MGLIGANSRLMQCIEPRRYLITSSTRADWVSGTSMRSADILWLSQLTHWSWICNQWLARRDDHRSGGLNHHDICAAQEMLGLARKC
jgi:hypothetical protein